MRILYTGPFGTGSMTEARRKALVALGHDVVELDQRSYFGHGPYLLQKAQLHSLMGPGIARYNRDILELARNTAPDLIYIDCGSYLWRQTVASLRATEARLVHYTSEYFGYRRYWYRHFLKAVPLYDLHVITNNLCEPVLVSKGAKKIVYTRFGYDPEFHRPLELTPEEREKFGTDVVFIGHWEKPTERLIEALWRRGIDVQVWGPRWWRGRSIPAKLRHPAIWGEDYVKVLNAAKICLCILSKCNHNQSAGRTFEIPAVGSFMLAERTAEQATYYEEGKEAEFFSSAEELVEKAEYYLAHEEERKAIARRGHERCLSSGYCHRARMQEVLKLIA